MTLLFNVKHSYLRCKENIIENKIKIKLNFGKAAVFIHSANNDLIFGTQTGIDKN